MLRAKWKSALARDSIGMTGDRLIQFGDLASEIVEDVISALRLSWPTISPERVRNNLEGQALNLLLWTAHLNAVCLYRSTLIAWVANSPTAIALCMLHSAVSCASCQAALAGNLWQCPRVPNARPCDTRIECQATHHCKAD